MCFILHILNLGIILVVEGLPHLITIHMYKHGIRASLVRQCGRPSVARGARFFAYSALIINFKGVFRKLKIVALEISVE